MTAACASELPDTPLKRVLGAVGKYSEERNGNFVALCPAHGDRNPSLAIREGERGRVVVVCRAGCETSAIVGALGLRMSDLFPPRPDPEKANGTSACSLKLSELVAHKKLNADHVESLGWRDAEHRGHPCVEIPYLRRDGTFARTRVRRTLTKDADKDRRFVWDGEGEVIAYEPDRGELARKKRFLIIVEGETDTVTLLFAEFPALGIPGVGSESKLERHHVEGVERIYISRETDDAGAKFVPRVRERLKVIGFAGAVHELPMPGAAKDPNTLWQRDPDAFAGRLQDALRLASEPPPPAPHQLGSLWRTLGDWGALASEPPPRRWLITRPDEETNGAAGHVGVLPLGKVGLLVASGGAGKTMLLVALALAAATGRKWLDYFSIASPGRVLLALGEEDQEEVWRRFYAVARAMRLTPEQEQRAAANVVVLPLAGIPVALVEADGRNTTATETLNELRNRLSEHEWRLIILDPLSRFAGPDTEKDNAAATRFIQAVESLVAAPGGPTVLIAHHTNKLARADGAKASASNARGSTAITDGARWVAELESSGDEGARLSITKSNYSRCGDPIELVRDGERGGYLRVATSEEARRQRETKEREDDRLTEERLRRMDDEVIAALAKRPGLSKSGLKDVVTGRGQDVGRSVERLLRAGRLRQSASQRHGFELLQEAAE